MLTLTAKVRAAIDVNAAMIERTVEGVQDNLDPGTAGLQMEIVAEAARNPYIAGIVQAAGHQDSEATLGGMAEAISAMFEGLRIRAIRNPDIDRGMVVKMFRRMVNDLLTQT